MCMLGGIQKVTVFTEDGLYDACMLSRKKIAKPLKKAVFHSCFFTKNMLLFIQIITYWNVKVSLILKLSFFNSHILECKICNYLQQN